MNAIQIIQPEQPNVISIYRDENERRRAHYGSDYRPFFDFEAAYQAVMDHISVLPSDATKRQNTRKNYDLSLKHFIAFLDERQAIPTPSVMAEYIAYCRKEKNKKSRSISASLPPIRRFCRSLATQPLPSHKIKEVLAVNPNSDLNSWDLLEWQKAISAAAQVSDPRPEKTTDVPALEAYGNRLSKDEIDKLLNAIDRNTLIGKRDYALILVMLMSGCRRFEVHSLKIGVVRQFSADTFTAFLETKRSKWRKIAIPAPAWRAVQEYVESYNALFEKNHPHRITEDSTLWRKITRHGGAWPDDPDAGITVNAINDIFKKYRAATGIPSLSPHDMRRTLATHLRDARDEENKEMPPQLRSEVFGHDSWVTTRLYEGNYVNYDELNAMHWGFNLDLPS